MNIQLVQTALQKYGLRSMPGSADSPQIMEMAHDCGFSDYTHDDMAWCSLFLNWVALKALYERSRSLAARSWLKTGMVVIDPEIGDVVILWRLDPNGPFGHVGLFIGRNNGLIYILGGNEGGLVQIEGFDPAKVLGYRRLSPFTPSPLKSN